MKKGQKSKDILFFARLFYPHIGGVEKHVYRLSQELLKKNYKVTVVTELYDKNLPLSETINGITIKRIPIGKSEKNKKFLIWKWMIKNRTYIKSFEIVHIHDVFFWILPITLGFNKSKIFITFHGYEGYPVRIGSKIQRKIAQKYCAASLLVGEFIKKWYGINSDFVTHGGVDLPKKPVKYDSNPISALFWGRIDELSGISIYYSAFKLLKKKYKNFSFAVIGDGEYAKKMKDVPISPFKSDISSDLNNARFAFVSGYLSILEALIRKKVVFAVFNNPLKHDYLKNSPFADFIEICSNEEELFERVSYYIENPDQEKKKHEAGFSFAKRQTWEALSNIYLKIWKI